MRWKESGQFPCFVAEEERSTSWFGRVSDSHLKLESRPVPSKSREIAIERVQTSDESFYAAEGRMRWMTVIADGGALVRVAVPSTLYDWVKLQLGQDAS